MDQGLEHSTARDSKIYKCNVYVYYGRFPGDWSTHRPKYCNPRCACAPRVISRRLAAEVSVRQIEIADDRCT